ncbi:MAG: thrombospondin type 3 repeat-containing protein, partial [Nitrosopumilaceae archaeon]
MRRKFSLQFWLLLVFTITSVPLFAAYAEESDLDNDGIPDNQDHCPNLPEDGLDEMDGCPSEHQVPHDSDSDGIDDHYDDCPHVRETWNGFQDEDGCPDSYGGGASGTPDADGDGKPDNIDSCPNQPETYNGILDLDGCPDDYISSIDTDQDGLPDQIDACPA